MEAGVKKYIKQYGGIDTSIQEAVQFVYDRFIKRVIDTYSENLHEVQAMMLYDEKDGENIVLLYDMVEVNTRRIYYLNVKQIIQDTKEFATQPSIVQCKYDAIYTSHVEAIAGSA